jgi:hypothetical protein
MQHKNIQIIFGVFENRLCSVMWFVFLVINRLYWGGVTFWFLIHFWKNNNALDVPRGGIQVCLDTKNNKALPLDLTFPGHLNVHSLVVLPYTILL